MKYIRTKDNRIYKLSNGVDFRKTKETYVWCFDKIFGFNFKVDTKNILEQADTIEELCDEFVAKKDNSKPFVIKRYEIYSNLQFGFTIYGAVWVGADLHSVAKTNDKGELELL